MWNEKRFGYKMRSCAICTTWYIREYEEDAADMNVNLYQIVKNSRK
ncbi:hypothetical protein AQ802_28835 [Burkholderia pseudomallei]|uniref:Uncharacterized protein n=3 Tax=Burkholderia pseudomallei TaxID=28450 RepID=Q63TR6_BURPS|nr:conserved hypothetical protein [Burkholderia pseudomallei 668]ACQ96782.1 conserved hypothetical protein [Burkholderia pseudomallei MSHR346]AFI66485.1 hypothetical protein BP1026B_I1865 [Burkholderia pseudomallei 1026b]AJW53002.1 hypothetical protein UQ47_07970 [Burkholderia pseudomallei]EBA46350.1 conserved hypothetical protein [Burkholderia pseudomallei 305]EEC33674.1 conserved hypothetical protein [Burkholderia pseudomallei 576]EES24662.1 conserved hypothetical protein [Burkholderia pseu